MTEQARMPERHCGNCRSVCRPVGDDCLACGLENDYKHWKPCQYVVVYDGGIAGAALYDSKIEAEEAGKIAVRNGPHTTFEPWRLL